MAHVPIHPWVDSADRAAVRIAMTVAAPGKAEGILEKVITEQAREGGEHEVSQNSCRHTMCRKSRREQADCNGDLAFRIGKIAHGGLTLQRGPTVARSGTDQKEGMCLAIGMSPSAELTSTTPILP